MYGNIRAATIQALTACTLWKLDRDTFKKIVLNAMIPAHAAFTSFIHQVPILSTPYLESTTEDERDRMIKASQRLQYPKGAEVISYGDRTLERYVFLIISGEVVIVSAEKAVLAHKGPYDYFGERAVLYEEPPQASVRAAEDIQVYRVPATVLLSLPTHLLEALRRRAETMHV